VLAAGAASARATCPPPVDAGSGLDTVLSQCTNWICDVDYDPSLGFLPEEDPVNPWIADLQPGTQVSIVKDRLQIVGSTNNAPPGEVDGAQYQRLEPALVGPPPSPIYVIQATYEVGRIYLSTESEEALAMFGAMDGDRLAVVSLGHYQGQRVVVHGEEIQSGNILDPAHVQPWDFRNETTYTLVVHRGVASYLLVDGEPVMVRDYDTLSTELPPNVAGEGVFGFSSAHSIASYSRVRYCACAEQRGPNIDTDGDGYTPAEGDCNELAADAHPGAEEIQCDGIDQDCDGYDECVGDAGKLEAKAPALSAHTITPANQDGKHDELAIYQAFKPHRTPGVWLPHFPFEHQVDYITTIYNIATGEPVLEKAGTFTFTDGRAKGATTFWDGKLSNGDFAPSGTYGVVTDAELRRTHRRSGRTRLLDSVATAETTFEIDNLSPIAESDIEPISQFEPYHWLYRLGRPVAVGMSEITYSHHCSGFLIGPNVLVTAGHCVGQEGTETYWQFNCDIDLYDGDQTTNLPSEFCNADSAAGSVYQGVVLFQVGHFPPDACDPNAFSDVSKDLAIVKLQGNPGYRFGWVKLAGIDVESELSDPQVNNTENPTQLVMIGHPCRFDLDGDCPRDEGGPGDAVPQPRPKKIVFDHCYGWHFDGVDFSDPLFKIRHSCASKAGFSGAPIFDTRGRVVAFHTDGPCEWGDYPSEWNYNPRSNGWATTMNSVLRVVHELGIYPQSWPDANHWSSSHRNIARGAPPGDAYSDILVGYPHHCAPVYGDPIDQWGCQLTWLYKQSTGTGFTEDFWSWGTFRPMGEKKLMGYFNNDDLLDVLSVREMRVAPDSLEYTLDLPVLLGGGPPGSPTHRVEFQTDVCEGNSQYFAGDFNGDGLDDFLCAVGDPGTPLQWKVLLSSGSSFDAPSIWTPTPSGWGDMSDTYLIGNFDGSPGDDIARAVLNTHGEYEWSLMTASSSTNSFIDRGLWSVSLGLVDDHFYVGDFNGDGLSDILITRWQEYPGWPWGLYDTPIMELHVSSSTGLTAPSPPSLWNMWGPILPNHEKGGRILIGNYDGDTSARDDVAIVVERWQTGGRSWLGIGPTDSGISPKTLKWYVGTSNGAAFGPFLEWEEKFGYAGAPIY